MTSVLSVVDPPAQESSESPKDSKLRAWSDWMGMVAAIGCAIHCAAMPFVIAYLPSLGLSFLADEGFHKWMAIGCFGIAVSAFVPGFRKHGSFTPLITGSVGLGLISFAAFGPVEDCCASGACLTEDAATEDADTCCAECEECEAENSTLATTDSTATGSTTVAEIEEDVCTDDCCQPDESTELAVASVAGSTGNWPSWLVAIVPWLTPLGGFVLIAAHLINHRECTCCGGCATDAPETP